MAINDQVFGGEDLDWYLEGYGVAPMFQTMAISRALGGQVSKLGFGEKDEAFSFHSRGGGLSISGIYFEDEEFEYLVDLIDGDAPDTSLDGKKSFVYAREGFKIGKRAGSLGVTKTRTNTVSSANTAVRQNFNFTLQGYQHHGQVRSSHLTTGQDLYLKSTTGLQTYNVTGRTAEHFTPLVSASSTKKTTLCAYIHDHSIVNLQAPTTDVQFSTTDGYTPRSWTGVFLTAIHNSVEKTTEGIGRARISEIVGFINDRWQWDDGFRITATALSDNRTIRLTGNKKGSKWSFSLKSSNAAPFNKSGTFSGTGAGGITATLVTAAAATTTASSTNTTEVTQEVILDDGEHDIYPRRIEAYAPDGVAKWGIKFGTAALAAGDTAYNFNVRYRLGEIW